MALLLVRCVGRQGAVCIRNYGLSGGARIRMYSTEGEASPRGPPYTTSLSTATLTAQPNSALHPVYRVLDTSGKVIDPSQEPQLSKESLVKMYQQMVTLSIMDQHLYKAQRMGLISFYMMCSGEEGIHFGTAAALDSEDEVYCQYREAGVFMWRGFTLDNFMNQCFSNKLDIGKGRQMPVHYGSKKLNIQHISSPLATQMPQAPGYAYALKRAGSKNCVICYFGDGAAQEGDAHAAMNFAATLDCPVIFMCRNNGYAISTPVEDQYRSDGLVVRGPAYGMEAIRVDGNDVLAVYNATKYARKVCVEEHRPVLLEAMTYRIGSHSTSDDQTGYQDMDIVKQWKKTHHPNLKLKNYLAHRGLWDEEKETALVKSVDADVKASMQRARKLKRPPLEHLFSDVFDELPTRLQQQKEELKEHLSKYGQHYPVDNYDEGKNFYFK